MRLNHNSIIESLLKNRPAKCELYEIINEKNKTGRAVPIP